MDRRLDAQELEARGRTRCLVVLTCPRVVLGTGWSTGELRLPGQAQVTHALEVHVRVGALLVVGGY